MDNETAARIGIGSVIAAIEADRARFSNESIVKMYRKAMKFSDPENRRRAVSVLGEIMKERKLFVS